MQKKSISVNFPAFSYTFLVLKKEEGQKHLQVGDHFTSIACFILPTLVQQSSPKLQLTTEEPTEQEPNI